MAHRDLREYLQELERRGKLHRITKEVDKDWEIAAVSRQVFQRIPHERRPCLLFENVKGFNIPVVTGAVGASKAVYAIALETTVDGIQAKWDRAMAEPAEPRQVPTGPCKENIILGEDVDLFLLPVPTWTVGKDPDPYLTAPFIFSKDPETGKRNIATYRMQLKGRNKLGLHINYRKDMGQHILKNEQHDLPTPVAVVIGADPTIGLTSVSDIPYGVEELAIAGGLRGEPMDVVKCETVDLEVPATAEIVIEGLVPPHYREMEGPFGEYTGYMGPAGNNFVMNVTAITFRNNPIYQAFASQMPPSESSCIRQIGYELPLLKHLKEDMSLPIKDLHLKESGGSAAIIAVSTKKEFDSQPKQVMWAIWAYNPNLGKIVIVVDDDIDVRDDFAVDWAMSFRMQPARDIMIVPGAPPVALDPSALLPDIEQGSQTNSPGNRIGSKMGIDATKKHAFPAASLPPLEHREWVDQHWDDYGLGHLQEAPSITETD